jgi:hypothetical protein
MPRSRLSVDETAAVWARLTKLTGSLQVVKPKPNWRATADGRVSIHVAFSQTHRSKVKNQSWGWYGLNAEDLETTISHYEHAFVIFIIDKQDHTLVVPLSRIYGQITECSLDSEGKYQFRLSLDFQLYRIEDKGPSLREFKNRFDLIQAVCRKPAPASRKRRPRYTS